ncbi:MAG: adenylate cyclase [Clostridiaceae bacterium]|jgi:CYTH domain-containing protein|nr:adenylate cyclase [Clostridiaceae bacterium]
MKKAQYIIINSNNDYFLRIAENNSIVFAKDKELATVVSFEDSEALIPLIKLYSGQIASAEQISHKEIERKWLFNSEKAPEGTKELGEYFYNQAYLSVNPEIRIRSKQNVYDGNISYKLCIKGKGTIQRIEVQKEITKEEFEQLMIIGNIKEEDFVKKHFYIYDINGYKLSLGVTDIGKDTEFRYGEIEFDFTNEANEFIAPDWFGKEVTYDNDYKMANYWERTRGRLLI